MPCHYHHIAAYYLDKWRKVEIATLSVYGDQWSEYYWLTRLGPSPVVLNHGTMNERSPNRIINLY